MKIFYLLHLLTLAFLPAAVLANEAELKQIEVSAYGKIQPLRAETVFGDSISPIRALTFAQTDVVISGAGPDISIARRFDYQSRLSGRWLHSENFADWTLDLPRISVTLPYLLEGNQWIPRWEVRGANKTARCSSFGPPDDYRTPFGTNPPSEFWHGVDLDIPGQGSQKLLARSNEYLPGQRTDLKLVTNGNWVVSCLPTLKSGHVGEGFLAISPEGEKYWFDWMSFRLVGDMYLSGETQPAAEFRMLVTRIEDRFGNSVTYNYLSDGRLQSITASDGRAIDVSWITKDGTQYYIEKVAERLSSGAGRSWRYEYEKAVDRPLATWLGGAVLRKVVLPDGSSSTFGIDSFSNTCRIGWDEVVQEYYGCANYVYRNGVIQSSLLEGTITAPSGAVGTWKIGTGSHYRGRNVDLDEACCGDSNYISVGRVYEKSITGPGVNLLWKYTATTIGQYSDLLVSRIQYPDGTVKAFTVHNVFHDSVEGRIKSVDTYKTATDTTPLSSTKYDYIRGAVKVGEASREQASGRSQFEWAWPVSKVETILGGTTFVRQDSNFDSMARPTKITKSSVLTP